jgi:hypothetical protein
MTSSRTAADWAALSHLGLIGLLGFWILCLSLAMIRKWVDTIRKGDIVVVGILAGSGRVRGD